MDFIGKFPDLTDSLQKAEIIYCDDNSRHVVNVRVDDMLLLNTNAIQISPIVADLVDLASGIYILDWFSPRKRGKRHQLHLQIPVRCPNALNHMAPRLAELLQWYTKDHWTFEFQHRQALGRYAERRPKLFDSSEKREVALWSGGADSLAGLIGRIKLDSAPSYTLLGTGSNKTIQGVQSKIAEGVQSHWPQRIRLVQIPINVQYGQTKPRANDSFRSRGLVFKILGAVCAYLEGQDILHVYENGYGALNLPFRVNETGLSHTRSVHPKSLIDTGEFLSDLFGSNFIIHNPYLYHTKAQMCLALRGYEKLAFETVTCDGRHRKSDTPTQCGYCSSCLLRRVAFLVGLGRDDTKYVLTHSDFKPLAKHITHFDAMSYQARELKKIFESDMPCRKLFRRYPELRSLRKTLISRYKSLTGKEVNNNLVELYRQHLIEWNDIRPYFLQQIKYA